MNGVDDEQVEYDGENALVDLSEERGEVREGDEECPFFSKN